MEIAVKNIDTYLALQPEKVRITLEKIRAAIKSAAPGAEETISYQVPTFKYYGMLISFAGFKNHCSIFPGPAAIEQFKDELQAFQTSKGTIQFTVEKPLPLTLVKKIVKARMQANLEKAATKKLLKK